VRRQGQPIFPPRGIEHFIQSVPEIE